MSQQQTKEALKQIQNNSLLIKQSDKLNDKYDEVLKLLSVQINEKFADTQTTEKFADIPARFESSSSVPDLEHNLFQTFDNSSQEKVTKTEDFRVEVIELVEKEEKKGKTWFQSLKDSLSSESIQNKLQSFKDYITSKTVKLGNKIASLPEERATQALMKTALDRIKEGRLLTSQTPNNRETYQVGDYQVIGKDNQFSLLDNKGNKLMEFSANDNLNNPSLISKSSRTDAIQIHKAIKDEPVKLNGQQAEQRQGLINRVSRQMQELETGCTVGDNNRYRVRSYQGEIYLDDGFGHQITQDDLSDLSYQDLEHFSQQFVNEKQQIQAEQLMPTLVKYLRAYESYIVESETSTVEFDTKERTMTFTSSQGERIKARSLGDGKWQHLEGSLSSITMDRLKNLDLELDRYFEREAQREDTREVLHTLG